MQIVDGQVHIWAASTPERPWLPPAPNIPAPHKPVPFTKDDLLREMNAAGVQGAILVTPMWEGVRNDLVLAAAQAHPDRFAVMGRLDPARTRLAWLDRDVAQAARHAGAAPFVQAGGASTVVRGPC
jgi:L-fuconolactonase